MRGLYLLANDRVSRLAVTVAASVRRHEPEVPIFVVPYDDRAQAVLGLLAEAFGALPFPDRSLLAELDRLTALHIPAGTLRNPTRLRKLACWLGPLDEFLYLDCDIVVFDRILTALDHLDHADFLWCDYQHRRLPDFVFRPSIFEEGVLDPALGGEIFNTGFLASRRGLFTLSELALHLREIGGLVRHLPFAKGVNDQPVLNYLVLRHVARRKNLVRLPGWRANAHPLGLYRVDDDYRPFDPAVGEPHKYLHWSGFRIEPGDPYWEVWRHHHERAQRQFDGAPARHATAEERACC